METMNYFKYLGRVLTTGDEDWSEVSDNPRKYRKRWVRMKRIQIWEGADPKVSGLFSKAVVQVVLLFV